MVRIEMTKKGRDRFKAGMSAASICQVHRARTSPLTLQEQVA
jgi:predicted unusual protein kinase regulating ubiquinone biosynthesis (AarF/ABC1/UbiB family)